MEGYVYIVAVGKNQHIYKIGIATNVQNRIKQLQTGCPHPIRLIGYLKCEDPRVIEKEFHEALKFYRQQGEWFDCSLEKIKCVQHILGLTGLFRKK